MAEMRKFPSPLDRDAMVAAFRRMFAALPVYPCRLTNVIRRVRGLPPLVSCLLETHPNIANSLKWQFEYQTSAYDVPETAKRAWPDWSDQEKDQLTEAFNQTWEWMKTQSGTYSASEEDLPYPPVNLHDTSNDNGSASTGVSIEYAWDLYIRWVALELAVEMGNYVPWSITDYSDEQLQVLFDSAAIMSRLNIDIFNVASGNPTHVFYVKRKDNLGASLIAPPWYTFSFLVNENILAASRLETIGNLLQWVSDNLFHFNNGLTYQNTEDHWGYRGNPPITRIIEGTTNPTVGPNGEFNHWTAGCHGTTGFIRNVLRAANIPVHISNICSHSQACFTTEGLYLDHGDNPYMPAFLDTGLPASALLIDHDTYVSWFGDETDNRDIGCDMVGHQADSLAGI